MRYLKPMAASLLVAAFATTAPDTADAGAHFDKADVMTFDGVDVGQATLRRTLRGITLKLDTSELEPGHAYSLWWVIFNNPNACAGGPGDCVGDDLATPAVEGSMMSAAGRIAKNNGRATLRAFLPVGFMHSGEGRQVRGPGLQSLFGAEIHAVLRTHGEAAEDPLEVVSQLSTLNGACNVECANVQFAVFPPRTNGTSLDNGD